MLVLPTRACLPPVARSLLVVPFFLLSTETVRAAPEAPSDLAALDGDMREAPPGSPSVTDPVDPKALPGHVIYLNYEGGTINGGGGYESDSHSNTSWVCQGTFSPFGAGQMQEASIQATREDWAAYGVTLVTSRPASGDYTMNMIGSSSCGPNNSGVAPVDCGNQNPNDIVFTFANSGAWSANGVATINSQEIAHSFGLMHVNEPNDIMNPSAGGVDNPAFLDQCISINGNVSCGSQHAAECGSQTSQNSHQELLTLFGPSAPDMGPPTVSITYPADGDQFVAPASFDVIAEASDDQALQELRISINGMDQNAPDSTEPFSWPVTGVPVGVYTFEVMALDTAGNDAVSAAVTVEVVEEGPETTTSSSSGSGGTGNSSGDSVTGADSDSGGTTGWDPTDGGGALPPGFGTSGDADAGSCACRQGGGPPLLPAALGVFVLGLTRRRR